MNASKLRRQIAFEAARLMYVREEAEYYRAKMKAARRIHKERVKPADLPSNAEIRDQIQLFARIHEGQRRDEKLLDMRLAALHMMRRLCRFRPRLIGSVLTGHVRQGSDIDLHVFSDSVEAVVASLEAELLTHDVHRKLVRKQGQQRVFTHIHVHDGFPFELTVYGSDKAHYVFKSSITGKAIERASIAELEQFLRQQYPNLNLEENLSQVDNQIDRFQLFESLLLPLENVKQNVKYHPEGDALYHSLQVYQQARNQLPYDEEFLLAALLHDVGKAIDPRDHVAAGLEALSGGFITQRTSWFIAHHMDAQRIHDGTLGSRAKRRLRLSSDYDELLLLAQCDRAGRQIGAIVPDVDEALDYIRELAVMFGD